MHGKNKGSLALQLGPECLKEYTIDRGAAGDDGEPQGGPRPVKAYISRNDAEVYENA